MRRSIRFARLLVLGALLPFSPFVRVASPATAPSKAVSAAEDSGVFYRVTIGGTAEGAKPLSQRDAEQAFQKLSDERLGPSRIEAGGPNNGRIVFLLSSPEPAREIAWSAIQLGMGANRIVVRIEPTSDAQKDSSQTESQAPVPGSAFRAGVSRFDRETIAMDWARILRASGLPEVVVEPEDGKFAVYAGHFNTVADAEKAVGLWQREKLIDSRGWVQNYIRDEGAGRPAQTESADSAPRNTFATEPARAETPAVEIAQATPAAPANPFAPQVSPAPSPSPTPEPVASPLQSPTPQTTPQLTPAPTPEPTATPTPTPSPTPAPTPTSAPTPTPTPAPTATPLPSPSPTAQPTPELTPVAGGSANPFAPAIPSATTPTATPVSSPTITTAPILTPVATSTPAPTTTPAPTPPPAPTPSPQAPPTPSPTPALSDAIPVLRVAPVVRSPENDGPWAPRTSVPSSIQVQPSRDPNRYQVVVGMFDQLTRGQANAMYFQMKEWGLAPDLLSDRLAGAARVMFFNLDRDAMTKVCETLLDKGVTASIVARFDVPPPSGDESVLTMEQLTGQKSGAHFRIAAGKFATDAEAEAASEKLKKSGAETSIESAQGAHRVFAGKFADADAANAAARRWTGEGALGAKYWIDHVSDTGSSHGAPASLASLSRPAPAGKTYSLVIGGIAAPDGKPWTRAEAEQARLQLQGVGREPFVALTLEEGGGQVSLRLKGLSHQKALEAAARAVEFGHSTKGVMAAIEDSGANAPAEPAKGSYFRIGVQKFTQAHLAQEFTRQLGGRDLPQVATEKVGDLTHIFAGNFASPAEALKAGAEWSAAKKIPGIFWLDNVFSLESGSDEAKNRERAERDVPRGEAPLRTLRGSLPRSLLDNMNPETRDRILEKP